MSACSATSAGSAELVLELHEARRELVVLLIHALLLGRGQLVLGLAELLAEFESVLVRDLRDQGVDLLLRRGERGGLIDRLLHVLALHVHVLELLLELVHHLRHLLQVHLFHRLVHRAHNVRHRARDALHPHRCFHARRDRIHARGEPQIIERHVLLSNRVLRVDARPL